MNHIAKTVSRVMTEMPTPSTQAVPTPEPLKNPKRMRSFQDFKTLGDPALVEMMDFAQKFEANVLAGITPAWWLTFCGTSGTGKTFLADIVYDRLKDQPAVARHRTLAHGARRVHWPKLAPRLKNEPWLIDELAELNLLLLDELSSGTDQYDSEKEKLCRILLPRDGKATLITSNHSLEDIKTLIDTRIASRMIRDGSVAIEVNTMDYALR
jgi:DNA replication protein DnaC